MTTRVVNVRDEKYDIYIGRANVIKDGYFGNPFRMDNESQRNDVLWRYQLYFSERIKNDREFRARVVQLKGKVLGCFCKPRACHGDVIVKWLEENVR